MEEILIGSHILQPNRQLLAGGEHVHLGARALQILSVLAEANGEIVTKDEIFEAIWPDQVVEENALQAHIAAIRKALGEEADRLKTLRGVGYQLQLEPRAHSSGKSAQPTSSESDAEPAEVARDMRRMVSPKILFLGFLALILAAALGVSKWREDGAFFAGGSRIPVLVSQFEVTGNDTSDNEALAAGLSDELIVRLRRIEELQIGTIVDESQVIPDDFANAYLVAGTVRKNGDRLRVTARLMEPGGEVRWSQNFDRPLAEMLVMQEDIAAEIARALSVPLEVGYEASEYGGTSNPEAFALFWRGYQNRLRIDRNIAISNLERAVEIDPGYLRALTQLSFDYGYNLYFSLDSEELAEWQRKSKQYAARALQVDPDSWLSKSTQAWSMMVDHDLTEAQRVFDSIDNPLAATDPEYLRSLANFEGNMGRPQSGALIRKRLELIDPIFARNPDYVFDYMMIGDYAEALAVYDRLAGDGGVNLDAQHYHAFWAMILSGQEERAMNFAEAIPFLGQSSDAFADFRDDPTFLRMDREGIARFAAENFGAGGQAGLASLATSAAFFGRHELAADLFREAYSRPGGFLWFNLWHPALAEFRKTGEFVDLIEQLGFIEAWRESGKWGEYCRPVTGTEIACS